MTIFELLNLVFQAGAQNAAVGVLNTSVNYDTSEMTLSVSIGPLSPRTRVVKLQPNNMITATDVTVIYEEVKHGMAQDSTPAVSDLTNAVEVSRLIDRIWKHLGGN